MRRGFAPDPTKGTFEKRIGARANSAKSLCDIRVPLEPPKLLGQGIMKRIGGARRQRLSEITPTFASVRSRQDPDASPLCFRCE